MVQMWDSIIQVKPENLKELYYSPAQRQELRCMADRLTALPLDSYDKPVLMFLEGLGKINRPFLNPTEDGILSLLESKN